MLAEAGEAAKGASLYLTLGHPAGTPESQHILASGIGRLILGAAPKGVEAPPPPTDGVAIAILNDIACRRLHAGYLSVVERKRPFVTARLAVSTDGKAVRKGQGDSMLLGETARRWNDMQRALADAVFIGWGTASADDPDLEVRLEGLAERHPLRVVVAGLKTFQPRMKLLTTTPETPVLVITIPEKKLDLPAGIELLRVAGVKGRPDLAVALTALAQRGVQNVFVETGPTLTEALLAAGLIDRFHVVLTEQVIGPDGLPATPRGNLDQRLVGAGFSLVDHRLLGADNLRTFERSF